jgi:hypothetical protein
MNTNDIKNLSKNDEQADLTIGKKSQTKEESMGPVRE